MNLNNKYEIGETVFYNLSNTQEGIVLNWNYDARTKLYIYEVSFGPGMTVPCFDTELSSTNRGLY
jgi:hypothetical protein